MDWSTWITIWIFIATITDFVVIQWPQTLIWMLMCPDDYINTIVIQQFFQTKPASSQTRRSNVDSTIPTYIVFQFYHKITEHNHMLWPKHFWTNIMGINKIKLHAWFFMVDFLTIWKKQNIFRMNQIQIYKIYSCHFRYLLTIK